MLEKIACARRAATVVERKETVPAGFRSTHGAVVLSTAAFTLWRCGFAAQLARKLEEARNVTPAEDTAQRAPFHHEHLVDGVFVEQLQNVKDGFAGTHSDEGRGVSSHRARLSLARRPAVLPAHR